MKVLSATMLPVSPLDRLDIPLAEHDQQQFECGLDAPGGGGMVVHIRVESMRGVDEEPLLPTELDHPVEGGTRECLEVDLVRVLIELRLDCLLRFARRLG